MGGICVPADDIEAQLQAVSVVSVRERALDGDETEEALAGRGYRVFELKYEQPVDHAEAHGPRFSQRIRVLHVDPQAPVLMWTRGYHSQTAVRVHELTAMLGANQIEVEHRFFGRSRPEQPVWQHLRIEQAAADHHRIVKAFKQIYAAKWVSSGASKGGMAALFHRRFFPHDVDATVAYVAPVSFGAPDARYGTFFTELAEGAYGEEARACSAKIRAFQAAALQPERRARLEAMLAKAAPADLSYDLLGSRCAYEAAVAQFEWFIWQYLPVSSCAALPRQITGREDDAWMVEWMSWTGLTHYYSDQGMKPYQAYYYQAKHQLGHPEAPTEHLQELLHCPAQQASPMPLPEGVDVTFEPVAMQDVAEWVATSGRSLMFVYGEHDPWSYAGYDLGVAEDSYKLLAPQGTHASRIKHLTAEDQAVARAIVSAWAGVEADSRPELRSLRSLDSPRLLEPGLHPLGLVQE